MEPIEITRRLSIPAEELEFTVSRSSGPGGQHVNKVSTRVTLRFQVAASPSLTDEQKALITERLGNRISRDGWLQVSSQASRSQIANRDLAVERFAELLRYALDQPTPRKPTKVSRAAKERRLEKKKRRSMVKHSRKNRGED